jgi:hypothetical protein
MKMTLSEISRTHVFASGNEKKTHLGTYQKLARYVRIFKILPVEIVSKSNFFLVDGINKVLKEKNIPVLISKDGIYVITQIGSASTPFILTRSIENE